jgi:hypothetical protein
MSLVTEIKTIQDPNACWAKLMESMPPNTVGSDFKGTRKGAMTTYRIRRAMPSGAKHPCRYLGRPGRKVATLMGPS